MTMQSKSHRSAQPAWLRFAVIFGAGFVLAFAAATLARADHAHSPAVVTGAQLD